MIWVAVFQTNLQFAPSGGFLLLVVVCFFRAISIPDYFVSVWKETVLMPFGLKWGHEMEGDRFWY